MIGIGTITADTEGDIIFFENPDSKLDDTTARASVTATIDGGGKISHYGYSDSDRKLEIKAELDEVYHAKLRAIFEGHNYINIATRVGLFKAAISRLFGNLGQITMTVLIEEKYA